MATPLKPMTLRVTAAGRGVGSRGVTATVEGERGGKSYSVDVPNHADLPAVGSEWAVPEGATVTELGRVRDGNDRSVQDRGPRSSFGF